MNNADAEWQMVFYPLVLHSFGIGVWKLNIIIPLHGYVVLHGNGLCV